AHGGQRGDREAEVDAVDPAVTDPPQGGPGVADRAEAAVLFVVDGHPAAEETAGARPLDRAGGAVDQYEADRRRLSLEILTAGHRSPGGASRASARRTERSIRCRWSAATSRDHGGGPRRWPRGWGDRRVAEGARRRGSAGRSRGGRP